MNPDHLTDVAQCFNTRPEPISAFMARRFHRLSHAIHHVFQHPAASTSGEFKRSESLNYLHENLLRL
jgi:hypothetical protein